MSKTRISPLLVVLALPFLFACQKEKKVSAPVPKPLEKTVDTRPDLRPVIWEMDPDATVVVSVLKNTSVPVTGFFSDVGGSLYQQGRQWGAIISAAIGSFETGKEERDANIRTSFFALTKFGPPADVTIRIEKITAPDGFPQTITSFTTTVSATVMLFGKRVVEQVQLQAKGSKKVIHVKTVKDLIVRFSKLGLADRLSRLIKVCGHKSIGDEIRVHFAGRFIRR